MIDLQLKVFRINEINLILTNLDGIRNGASRFHLRLQFRGDSHTFQNLIYFDVILKIRSSLSTCYVT